MSTKLILYLFSDFQHVPKAAINSKNLIYLCNYLNMRKKQKNLGYKMNCTLEVVVSQHEEDERLRKKIWHFIEKLSKIEGDTLLLYCKDHVPSKEFAQLEPQHVFRILPTGEHVNINVHEIPKMEDKISNAKYLPYLQILGLHVGVTVNQVKQTYRKLALQYHPDKTRNCETSKQRFVEITHAYQIILQ